MIQLLVGNSRKSVNSIYIWEAIEPDFCQTRLKLRGREERILIRFVHFSVVKFIPPKTNIRM